MNFGYTNDLVIFGVVRRKIKEKIEITNKAIKTGGHRPSFLCIYKKKYK